MHQRKSFMIASKLEKHALLVTINSLAALSIFFFGYDQGMMGGVNESPDYIETMGIGRSDNGALVVTNSLLQGGIVAIFYLGTLIGCLIGGAFGDKYGRIRTIGLGSSISILGAGLQCSAQNSTWMLVARVINGIGTGALNTIVPAWASEVAEHTSRGKFIAIEFTLNIFGVVVAYWLGYGVKVSDGQSAFQWRFPIAFQIIPLLLLFGACWFFPESPRWLCRVDRDDEALFILQRLRGVSGPDEGKADSELMDIKRIVELETTDNNSYIHMLFGIKSGRLHTGRRVQLCIWLQIMQNWVGISAVTIYGPTIFSIAGYPSSKSQWLSGLNNVFYTLSTLICVFTLDRIGRRRTLFWGSTGQAVAMFLAGGFCRLAINATANNDQAALASYGAAATSMIYIFTFIFGATWLTVPWVYPAETFPLQVRAKGTAWGVVGWSLGNGTLTVVLPYMISAINEKTLYIFGACNILSVPIIWALYPESANRTLEEIDMLFAAETPWVWDAEKTFALLQKQELENRQTREDIMLKDMSTRHYETASQSRKGGPSRLFGSSSDDLA